MAEGAASLALSVLLPACVPALLLPAGQQLRQVVVPHSLSLAWRLGKAVAAAQHAKQDAPEAIAATAGGRVLFTGTYCLLYWTMLCCSLLMLLCDPFGHLPPTVASSLACAGKVVDVQRQTTGGFARGQLLLEGSGAVWAGRMLRILFQNENLLAYEQSASQKEQKLGQQEEEEQQQQQQQRLLAAVPDLICCVESESEWPAAQLVAAVACQLRCYA